MRYLFTKHRQIINENLVKVPLDEPLNPLTIDFVAWQSAGGTIEESDIVLPEEEIQIMNEKLNEFIIKKKKDGSKYFNDLECKITTQLYGMERTELMALLVEMNNVLYPPLNLMRGGDFASAVAVFQNVPETENEMILGFWNEARMYAMRYYLENYPR